MSLKMEYHSKWKVTQNGIPLKIEQSGTVVCPFIVILKHKCGVISLIPAYYSYFHSVLESIGRIERV